MGQYESETYEAILRRALQRVDSDLDQREGAVIYDAIAPLAAELAQAYIALGWTLDQGFAPTADAAYLERRAAEFGFAPTEATPAILRGEFSREITLGDRFALGEFVYKATARLDGGYAMTCETPGRMGSSALGDLLPITHIQGLEWARLTAVLEPGTDREETEHFRARFLSRLREPATSGNAYHYKQWALETPGVGAVRVLPLWAGPGTVKILVADVDRQPAGAPLLDLVAKHVETVRPLGAAVTVAAPVLLNVSVTATIILAPGAGRSLGQIQEDFAKAATEYLEGVVFEQNYISLSVLGSLLMGVAGVREYNALLLNGKAENLTLTDAQVPRLRVQLEV